MRRDGRIDYRMRRHAVLRELRTGLTGLDDVQDAHRELLRAGKHLGDHIDEPCPLCGDDDALRQVVYVFTGRSAKSGGDGGAAVPRHKLAAKLERDGDAKVYEVEVCLACHWHHLLESYWLYRTGRGASTG